MFARLRFNMLKAGAAALGPIATAYVMPTSASDGWTFNKYRFKSFGQQSKVAACMEQPSEPSQPSAPSVPTETWSPFLG